MKTGTATTAVRGAPIQSIRLITWAVGLGGAALVVYGAIDTQGFLTGTNVRSVLAQSAFVGVFALATTVIMISGNLFSLSLAVTGAVTASSFLAMLPHGQAIAILSTLAIGTGICAIQGCLVGAFGANPIIVTIAAGGLQEGIFLWLSGGATIVPSFTDTSFQWLNQVVAVPWVGPLPLAVMVFIALVVAVEGILRSTRFGQLVYFVGENRPAAIAAGIPTAWVITGAFGVAGLLTAIVGVELGAFNQSGSLLVESNFTYDGIAAAVVGGTAITGGQGSAFRALVGSILMASIADIVLLRGYSEGWQILIQGLVVLAVVVLARINRMKDRS